MPANSSGELAGRVAVVTGSSSGIGRAIVRELAAAGASCVVHGNRSGERARAVADALAEQGSECRVELCDVADAAACARFVEDAWNWHDGVDIWVNNAGADVLTGAAANWSAEEKLEMLWRVDVAGTIRLSRAIAARMQRRGRGVVVNIGWDQAQTGMDGDSGQIFAATKGAIEAFTRSLARSHAPQVRANCVAPGWIKTTWAENASPYWQDRAKRESLVQRWGTPEDIAAIVRFLASDAASFVNGQTVAVNGGAAR
jgi:3-oxoacyl-[acyl-carrier protein] reductase